MVEHLHHLEFRDDDVADGWSFQHDGRWTKLVNPSGERILSLTVCYTFAMPRKENVTMYGSTTSQEPSLSWHSDTDRGNWVPDTEQVRKHLGATKEALSHRDRGILDLQPGRHGAFSDRPLLGNDWLGDLTLSLAVEMIPIKNSNETDLPETPKKDFPKTELVETAISHAALFSDIINTTGNPAIAIQSLFTILYQMHMYEKTYSWDSSDFASYILSEDILVPVRKAGLIGIVLMLVIHLLVVISTVTLFLYRTKATLIGNAWQAAAQLITEQTHVLFEQADGMSDKEIKEKVLDPASGSLAMGQIRKRKNGRYELAY